MRRLEADAELIWTRAIERVLPETAVRRALANFPNDQNIHLLAIGKAAWRMAAEAARVLGDHLIDGLVITKYRHSQGEIHRLRIIEAGHPIPDENSVRAAELALEWVRSFGANDHLIFLISGGGSSLFEKPAQGVSLAEIAQITEALLRRGAEITQINAVRKHLSAVKGGRFAECCAPCTIQAVVLSDVLGDRLDSIASGPAYPDSSTSEEAMELLAKYGIAPSENLSQAIRRETPKSLDNVCHVLIGNVTELCKSAAETARELGYAPLILTSDLSCEAREAGRFVSAMAREIRRTGNPIPAPCALIFGGETLVHVRGKGRGGRNQELALSAAPGLSGLGEVMLFSLGSDGTDGPTDAAGAFVDGEFYEKAKHLGLSVQDALEHNDAYPLLKKMNALIMTGPTGTNVNDLSVLLIR